MKSRIIATIVTSIALAGGVSASADAHFVTGNQALCKATVKALHVRDRLLVARTIGVPLTCRYIRFSTPDAPYTIRMFGSRRGPTGARRTVLVGITHDGQGVHHGQLIGT